MRDTGVLFRPLMLGSPVVRLSVESKLSSGIVLAYT